MALQPEREPEQSGASGMHRYPDCPTRSTRAGAVLSPAQATPHVAPEVVPDLSMRRGGAPR